MTKLTPILAALCVLSSSAAAIAQSQPPAAAPPATTATTQPSFGELLTSLNDVHGEIVKVQAMNGGSANNIRPVNVTQLNGTNPGALNSAETRNQAQLNALRSTLGRVTVTTPSNEHITLAQFLADNKISTTQVVGADVSNGTLMLFYQKP